jgi:branched-chain amino acid transport system substrate-binding protein
VLPGFASGRNGITADPQQGEELMKHALHLAALMSAALLLVFPAMAQKNYAPGVSDTEIKIGQTMPYSGPLSAFGTIGRAEAAYFAMINNQGGVNGRKINLISLDDGYSPPKAVEQIRRLVERDGVAFIFQSLGAATNLAFRKYLNDRGVPQLFIAAGSSGFDDPAHFHWTMSWQPNFHTEAIIYAKYILAQRPDAKIAVLYQNDDFGKDYVQGLRDGLGDRFAKMVVMTASYEATDPTVDSQIVQLQSSGADVLLDVTTPKFAAQAIRKTYAIGWKPLHIMTYVSSSIAAVLRPAGLEKSVGLISAAFLKDPNDPQWKNDPAVADWRAWMAKYYPTGDLSDPANVYAYLEAQTLVHVLKQCGDDLSRENIMQEAANIHQLALPLLLPGMTLNTSPTDYRPVKQMQLARFDGKTWVRFGELFGAEQ